MVDQHFGSNHTSILWARCQVPRVTTTGFLLTGETSGLFGEATWVANSDMPCSGRSVSSCYLIHALAVLSFITSAQKYNFSFTWILYSHKLSRMYVVASHRIYTAGIDAIGAGSGGQGGSTGPNYLDGGSHPLIMCDLE